MEIDREKLFEIGKVKNKKILDVGVGPLGKIAAEKFSCIVTTIDMNPEMLEKAKVIKFEKQNATALSYRDNSFDVSISWCALHHTSPLKRKNFISELCRVAKEKIIIADFTEKGFPHSSGEYKIVDMDWLEKELRKYGKIEKYDDGKIILYILYIL